MDQRKIPWKSEWKAAGLDPGPMTEAEQNLVPELEVENRAFLEKYPFKNPGPPKKKTVLRFSALALPLAAAAALVLFVAVPQGSGPAPGQGLERIKGSGDPVLSLYREGKTGAEKLVSGAVVRAGDVVHSQADLERAEACLGYRPRVDLEAGLAEAMAWYRDHL